MKFLLNTNAGKNLVKQNSPTSQRTEQPEDM